MGRSTDEAAFDEFYRGTAHRVVHLVYAHTGDASLAQESAQEAYTKAWADWGRVQHLNDPLSWVRTVARRHAISVWRHRTAGERAYTRHGPPADPTEPGLERVIVIDALQQLSAVLRETVALHYLADLPLAQIAEELDVPEGTVKARLHRGRRELAAILRADPSTVSSSPTSRKER